jgi:hypothetical protein
MKKCCLFIAWTRLFAYLRYRAVYGVILGASEVKANFKLRFRPDRLLSNTWCSLHFTNDDLAVAAFECDR